MYQALKETINPKGGHGMNETLLFILLVIVVIAVIVFNYAGIEIDPMIKLVLQSLLGYMVGKNAKEKWTGEERRQSEETNEDWQKDFDGGE